MDKKEDPEDYFMTQKRDLVLSKMRRANIFFIRKKEVLRSFQVRGNQMLLKNQFLVQIEN